MAAKQVQQEDVAPSQDSPVEAEAYAMSLTEFCENLSRTDKRTEMISAFYRDESKYGHDHGLASVFQGRFIQFTNKPA